jgi:putative ABC transport system permease protein
VPELKDLQREVKSLTAFGDFSTIEFTMVGLGDPRSVRAGVVGGSYFDVMGLRAVRGRLLGPNDDRKDSDGAAVLTYRFWKSAFKSDEGVIGKRITLSDRPEIIANVVTHA